MIVNFRSVPDWLIWLKYISWFMYTNELLVVNQWADTNVTGCTPDVIESGTPCFPNGNAVLEFYGFSEVSEVIETCGFSKAFFQSDVFFRIMWRSTF